MKNSRLSIKSRMCWFDIWLKHVCLKLDISKNLFKSYPAKNMHRVQSKQPGMMYRPREDETRLLEMESCRNTSAVLSKCTRLRYVEPLSYLFVLRCTDHSIGQSWRLTLISISWGINALNMPPFRLTCNHLSLTDTF